MGSKLTFSVEELLLPDITLRDYNQRPIPIGACTELTFRWKDRTVTATAYIWSDLVSGEPCLLGTNVVMPLKLMVPDVGVEARGGSVSVEGIVHLIGTHRIPVIMLRW